MQQTVEAKARALAKKKGVTASELLPLVLRDLSQADCSLDLPRIPGPDSGLNYYGWIRGMYALLILLTLNTFRRRGISYAAKEI